MSVWVYYKVESKLRTVSIPLEVEGFRKSFKIVQLLGTDVGTSIHH